ALVDREVHGVEGGDVGLVHLGHALEQDHRALGRRRLCGRLGSVRGWLCDGGWLLYLYVSHVYRFELGRARMPGAGRVVRSGPHSSAAFGALRSISCSLQQISADETIQVAVEDTLRVADFVLGPVVLDELVGVQDVAADRVAAESHRNTAALAGELGL